MPESVVRGELESLNICVQGVKQLRTGRRDPDPAKDRPPTPQIIVSVARRTEVYKVRSLTEFCGLRVSVASYLAPKGPLQCMRCHGFGRTQQNCRYAPRCVAFRCYHLTGGCSKPREQPACCGCGGNNTANYCDCVKWKEWMAAIQCKRPSAAERGSPQTNLPLVKLIGPVHLPSRRNLARGGITSSEEAVSSRQRRTHTKTHTQIPILIRPRRRPRSRQ